MYSKTKELNVLKNKCFGPNSDSFLARAAMYQPNLVIDSCLVLVKGSILGVLNLSLGLCHRIPFVIRTSVLAGGFNVYRECRERWKNNYRPSVLCGQQRVIDILITRTLWPWMKREIVTQQKICPQNQLESEIREIGYCKHQFYGSAGFVYSTIKRISNTGFQ